MYDRILDKLTEIDKVASEFQSRLHDIEVTPAARDTLSILSDLLIAIDIARRDIYWAVRDIDEEQQSYKERRK